MQITTIEQFRKRYEYDLTKDRIDSGSFDTVFKALDTINDQYVAIKIADVKIVNSKEYALRDEFEQIKRIPPHTNIAKYEAVYRLEQASGFVDFGVMQYYKAGNLSALIKSGKLDNAQKKHIAKQILVGLAHLHHNGVKSIIHRDLKPSNILIAVRQKDGLSEYIPKIADFSFSKSINSEQSKFSFSIAGGTLKYFSPEQLNGSKQLGYSSDLWSWAVIVYELFMGKALFAIDSPHSKGSADYEADVLKAIKEKDLSSAMAELPAPWKGLLSSCLQRDPEQRVQSARELLRMLEPSSTVEVSVPKEKMAEKEMTIFEIPPAVPLAPEPKAAPATTRGYMKYILLFLGMAVLGAAGAGIYRFMQHRPSSVATPVPMDTSSTSMASNDGVASNSEDLDTDEDGVADSQDQCPTEAGDLSHKGCPSQAATKDLDTDEDGIADSQDQCPTEAGELKNKGCPSQSATKPDPNWRKKYEYVMDFKEGRALVQKDGKYGFVDKDGTVVIPLIYDDAAQRFEEGTARVKKDRKWGFVDKEGTVVVPLIYDNVALNFSEGRAMVNKDRKWGFVDKDGTVVIPLIYDGVGNFSEGWAMVKKDGKWGYVDKKGTVVIPRIYDDAGYFSEGRAGIGKNGKWGYVDKDGTVVIPLIYDDAWPFDEGRARVQKDGKVGYVDKEGKVIIPLIYDNGFVFKEGRAGVQKNGKWGFVDKEGRVVIQLIYDYVDWSFSEGKEMVRKDGKSYYINKQGECVKNCP